MNRVPVGQYRVGRAPDCDICLDESTIGRYHALIDVRGDGGISVRDLNSMNGTTVIQNGGEVTVAEAPVDVTEDAGIRLGSFELPLADLLSRVRPATPRVAAPQPPFAPVDMPVGRPRAAANSRPYWPPEPAPAGAKTGKIIAFLAVGAVIAVAAAVAIWRFSASTPVRVITFTASPLTTAPGASVVLRWEVEGATRVTILPNVGDRPARGEQSVAPTATTTYTLTVPDHPRAGIQHSVTVAVEAPARTNPAPAPPKPEGVATDEPKPGAPSKPTSPAKPAMGVDPATRAALAAQLDKYGADIGSEYDRRPDQFMRTEARQVVEFKTQLQREKGYWIVAVCGRGCGGQVINVSRGGDRILSAADPNFIRRQILPSTSGEYTVGLSATSCGDGACVFAVRIYEGR